MPLHLSSTELGSNDHVAAKLGPRHDRQGYIESFMFLKIRGCVGSSGGTGGLAGLAGAPSEPRILCIMASEHPNAFISLFRSHP
jgi:hypothetical protein